MPSSPVTTPHSTLPRRVTLTLQAIIAIGLVLELYDSSTAATINAFSHCCSTMLPDDFALYEDPIDARVSVRKKQPSDIYDFELQVPEIS
ncbi:MAG: hypothetical protein Q8M16_05595 [Pirellulaceae bacterium]|nr:hypothetical protein [Pirellulaceae bacterium]